ncbi:NAD(P)/FAD-dependent oxidoreductase [bacterium]|nr:NAD(P)/FAD-dependent oxidoreductase [bacterium]
MLFDIVIIGASVGGLSSALELLKNGIYPIMIEQRREIGIPAQCAEYIPAHFASEVSILKNFRAQRIDRMTAKINIDNDIITYRIAAPGCIINRDKWEQFLAQKVIDKGGKIFTAERAIAIEKYDNHYRIITTKRTLEARFIIGADGPKSITAKFFKIPQQKIIYSIQWTVPLRKKLFDTMVVFDRKFKGGYGWLFPKGDIANLGVGAENLVPDMLEDVAEFFGEFIVKKTITKTGGAIPIGGLREKISDDKIFLVGDAAGTTDPITGAGIANAYDSGKIAGGIVAEALKSPSNSEHKNLRSIYDKKIRFLKRALDRTLRRRKNLLNNWNKDDEEFIDAIRRAWNFRQID